MSPDVYTDAAVGSLNGAVVSIAAQRSIKLPKLDALGKRRGELFRLSKQPMPALPDPGAKDLADVVKATAAARVAIEAENAVAAELLSVVELSASDAVRDSAPVVVDVLVKVFDQELAAFKRALPNVPSTFDPSKLAGGSVSVDSYAAFTELTNHALALEGIVADRLQIARGLGELTVALRARSHAHWPLLAAELAEPPTNMREVVDRFTPLWHGLQAVAETHDAVDRWRTLYALEANGYLRLALAGAYETPRREDALMRWRHGRDGVQSPEERISSAAADAGVLVF